MTPTSTLDELLTLQLVVAWAGEGKSDPPRLAWWRTDLVDPEGGGDLLARLLPRTHRWAALEAVREVARRVDERARRQTAAPDRLRTLFHLGFELDERLADRLLELKREGRPPEQALPGLALLTRPFDRTKLAAFLQPDGAPAHKATAAGRHLKGDPPLAPELLAQKLAAALIPFAEHYPAPYFEAPAP